MRGRQGRQAALTRHGHRACRPSDPEARHRLAQLSHATAAEDDRHTHFIGGSPSFPGQAVIDLIDENDDEVGVYRNLPVAFAFPTAVPVADRGITKALQIGDVDRHAIATDDESCHSD